MRSRIARFGACLAIASACLACICVGCNDSDWVVEGTVRNPKTNSAIFDAKVLLRCNERGTDPRDKTVRSDRQGRYSIEGKGKRPADCTLSVEEPSYITTQTKLGEGLFEQKRTNRLTFDVDLVHK